MKKPSYEIRKQTAEWAHSLRDLTDEEAESGLDGLLGMLYEQLQSELREGPPEQQERDIEEMVSSCHAWASLVSHAVAEVYAPNSPFPRKVAGWGNKAIVRLSQITATLRKPLGVAQQSLGAGSYSISVGFPWGISIGFSWP
ncbi:MAG: hypothetical protein EPN69_03700 [Rhodanobacter sp.]|nr:MAG: hypothetical protein EPN69_03700 [Rhodanobacter sp.]TAM43227.1 MAG: hypothetical protein EPN58_00160 [Rhodanobacter sp.]TAN28902.1 MAG: hypothetical protein EPN32_01900 [Rhodanobacter sp.]